MDCAGNECGGHLACEEGGSGDTDAGGRWTMKPAPFEYVAAGSLAEALKLKAEYGDDAKFLAGGQSLVPAMNFRLVQAAALIDINGVSELQFSRREADGLTVGALTRQRQLERSEDVRNLAPLLFETVPFVAHPQIRNRGTLGGSLAHADPAAELPVVAVALDASFRLQSSAADRWVTAKSFFKGLFMTELAFDELLTEVKLPALPARTGCAFTEFARRRGDYAIMGVAAVVTLDEAGQCTKARLVYLNAGDGPVDAAEAAGLLIGAKPDAAAIQAAARTAAEREISPMGNVHASVAYQHHLANVLTVRALKTAVERASATV